MATTNATAPKSAPKKSQGFTGIKSGFAVIIVCFLIAECLYVFGAGHLSNFHAEGATGLPFHFFQEQSYEPAGIVGTVYKGGFIVPIIWTLFITVIALAIERAFAIGTANGKGNLGKFAAAVKSALKQGDLQKAEELCNKQKGSVANVVSASLNAYKEMENSKGLKLSQKVSKIQQAHEEATQLEMPTLQMNLPIIASIVTLGTLTGLLGTVIGMIRSFAALAAGGGGDSLALSEGISEALVNTASGIATSWFAVVSYNTFTNKIDKLTYALDEVGYSIAQTFEANHTEEA